MPDELEQYFGAPPTSAPQPDNTARNGELCVERPVAGLRTVICSFGLARCRSRARCHPAARRGSHSGEEPHSRRRRQIGQSCAALARALPTSQRAPIGGYVRASTMDRSHTR